MNKDNFAIRSKMVGRYSFQVLLVWFALICTQTLAEKLDACKLGKYLWKPDSPSKFYYCYNDEKDAVQLACKAGTKMCKLDGQAFEPCACKNNGTTSQPNEIPNVPGNAGHASGIAGDTSQQNDRAVAMESFPANGCPDPFQVFSNSHMFRGNLQDTITTLRACQVRCLLDDACIGMDWDKQPTSQQNERCYVLYPDSLAYGRYPDTCCDHYQKTTCIPSTPDSPISGSTTGITGTGNGVLNATARVTTPISTPSFTTTTQSVPTPTIPDTGCPFTLEKFEDMSHPGGVNVTLNMVNVDIEGCKQWCLISSFCAGVDWDDSRKTCYLLREVNPSYLVSSVGVTHFRKGECGPPLKCWVVEPQPSNSLGAAAVTDPSTPQEECYGYCYVRQVQNAVTGTSTTERGCIPMSSVNNNPGLNCEIDETLLIVTCYCDTARCNGLSLNALASQLLYLPLDEDTVDHSGFNRDGTTASKFSSPQYSCLERAVNCSAFFTGGQCIAVRQLSQTTWGTIDEVGRFVPTASFAVWYKRLSDGSTEPEGIFGNSEDSTEPSWRIMGNQLEDFLDAGVLTSDSPTNLDDYVYVSSPIDQWHLAVITYDGRHNSSIGQFPILQFFVDGSLGTGNARADSGNIEIRSQPVTVGCVQEKGFTGYIDEARIFALELGINDIYALMAMREDNHFFS